MTGYTKLFGSIVASTIWDEDNETRIVWITMLAMANKFGIVEASLPGLAKFARVPLVSTQKALQKFMSPDPYSRSKEHEGRRIEETEGGWKILNHSKYREKLSPSDRREYLRLKQREHRAKAKPCQQPSTNPETSTNCLLSTQAEAEAEAEAKTDSYTPPSPSVPPKGNCLLDLKSFLSIAYKRPLGIVWPYDEETALVDVVKRRPAALAEWLELKSHFNDEFFPKSIRALLENWDSTVDRYRTAEDRKPKPKENYMVTDARKRGWIQ